MLAPILTDIMRVPGKSNIHHLFPWWLFFIIIAPQALGLTLRPWELIGTCIEMLALVAVILLLSPVLTPTHVYSIFPRRRVRLADAKLTLIYAEGQKDPTMCCIKLYTQGKTTWLQINLLRRAERQHILDRLRTSCRTCTEQYTQDSLFGLPRVTQGGVYQIAEIILLATAYLLPLIKSYDFSPTPAPVKDAQQIYAQHTAVFGHLYWKQKWYNPLTAKDVADELMELAEQKAQSSAPEDADLAEQYRATALSWYRRAGECGNPCADILLAYHSAQGAPVEATAPIQARAEKAYRELTRKHDPSADEISAIRLYRQLHPSAE